MLTSFLNRKKSKRELIQEMMFVNTCVKFRDNRIRNKKNVKSVKFDVDLVFDNKRSKSKLIQEVMFVNTCVKFRDNWIIKILSNLSNSMLL